MHKNRSYGVSSEGREEFGFQMQAYAYSENILRSIFFCENKQEVAGDV